jgi:hypothetical protein
MHADPAFPSMPGPPQRMQFPSDDPYPSERPVLLTQLEVVGDKHRLANVTRVELFVVLCRLVEPHAFVDEAVKQGAIGLKNFERVVKVASHTASAELKSDTGVRQALTRPTFYHTDPNRAA